jgi:hypothetical protein
MAVALIVAAACLIVMGGFFVVTALWAIADCEFVTLGAMCGAEVAANVGLGAVWGGYEVIKVSAEEFDVYLPHAPLPFSFLPPMPLP